MSQIPLYPPSLRITCFIATHRIQIQLRVRQYVVVHVLRTALFTPVFRRTRQKEREQQCNEIRPHRVADALNGRMRTDTWGMRIPTHTLTHEHTSTTLSPNERRIFSFLYNNTHFYGTLLSGYST